MTDELLHYGTPRKSGRYPWGSGKDPQRNRIFASEVARYRKEGMTDTQIAHKYGISTSDLRRGIALSNETMKAHNMTVMHDMKAKGYTNTEIAKELSISEGSVRNQLKQATNPESVKTVQISNVSDGLKERLTQAEYLDIGLGTEVDMGISRTKLLNAVAKLKEEGYYTHEVKIKQISDPSKRTTILVLTKDPDSLSTYMNSDKIEPVALGTTDGGLTSLQGLQPIDSISSKKVLIRYAEEGGTDKDGVIELRQGHPKLDLGDSRYAQVRIGVDDSHYLKGMAVYGDIPAGYDIVFNTNKAKGTNKLDVLKEMKANPDNRFGASIKPNGQRGHLNIVNEEGDWSKWSDTLSSQMLSKQPIRLIKDRLDQTLGKVDSRLTELNALTNPVVRSHFLNAYGNELDSKARHLKVEAIPGSKNHVLLPYPNMKPGEVYAPNYKNGDKVVLIRHPHGGTFEIPELTVNNKTPVTKGIRNAIDAIGIHPSVASKLSGADFDGDSVIVIPNNNKAVKFDRSLKELKNFDPNKYHVGKTTMGDQQMQTQMGMVSNLITDMTIKKASQNEIARAVKHSMVVIDAKKHKLDWKQSARDNSISALQKKYQTHVDPVTGKKSVAASTLVSKSKKVVKVGATQETTINPKTGRKNTKWVGGVETPILSVVKDARKLSSGTAVENQYAAYMNKLITRREKITRTVNSTPKQKTTPGAKKKYHSEIKTLQEKVDLAVSNAPRERQAQLMATKTYYNKLDYSMSKDEKKRLKSQALGHARSVNKSARTEVTVTPNEWKAIQSGAVSNNLLLNVLRYGNQDQIMKMASPRKAPAMSSSKLARARLMLGKGNTQADVAKALGVSVSTLTKTLNE